MKTTVHNLPKNFMVQLVKNYSHAIVKVKKNVHSVTYILQSNSRNVCIKVIIPV